MGSRVGQNISNHHRSFAPAAWLQKLPRDTELSLIQAFPLRSWSSRLAQSCGMRRDAACGLHGRVFAPTITRIFSSYPLLSISLQHLRAEISQRLAHVFIIHRKLSSLLNNFYLTPDYPSAPKTHHGSRIHPSTSPRQARRLYAIHRVPSSKTDFDLVRPYNEYDAVMRKIFAQEPDHPATTDDFLNIVPLFDDNGSADVKMRTEDPMALRGWSLVSKSFRPTSISFCENSIHDLDWNNVVAPGSAVATSLVPVPEKYAHSKHGLHQFYHEEFAPTSDVDLFLYGLSEEQALEKIKQIERCIKGSVVPETSTIRTKHAITVVSQYPTRHVQIVLRLYKSVAEILTGFDVDCSYAAYNGRQVYLAPWAIRAYITQTNHVDLSRRSPSYENHLSKYSHRGFEVFWPDLEHSQIDPTIFKHSFARTAGLAQLLVLEQLPKSCDRKTYLQKRLQEQGRPINNAYRYRYSPELEGNVIDD